MIVNEIQREAKLLRYDSTVEITVPCDSAEEAQALHDCLLEHKPIRFTRLVVEYSE